MLRKNGSFLFVLLIKPNSHLYSYVDDTILLAIGYHYASKEEYIYITLYRESALCLSRRLSF